jgi:hypothetical protein
VHELAPRRRSYRSWLVGAHVRLGSLLDLRRGFRSLPSAGHDESRQTPLPHMGEVHLRIRNTPVGFGIQRSEPDCESWVVSGGRHKKSAIVALARKLLVALWKYVTAGVVIEGAVMKTAG